MGFILGILGAHHRHSQLLEIRQTRSSESGTANPADVELEGGRDFLKSVS